jgi:hypothetical protein
LSELTVGNRATAISVLVPEVVAAVDAVLSAPVGRTPTPPGRVLGPTVAHKKGELRCGESAKSTRRVSIRTTGISGKVGRKEGER